MSSCAASTGRSGCCFSAPALLFLDPNCTLEQCGFVYWVPCLFVCSWAARPCPAGTRLIHSRTVPCQTQKRHCLAESRKVHISDSGSQRHRTTKNVWLCRRWWSSGARWAEHLDHRINGRRATGLRNKNSYLDLNPLSNSPHFFIGLFSICLSVVNLLPRLCQPTTPFSELFSFFPPLLLDFVPLWLNVSYFEDSILLISNLRLRRTNARVIAEAWLGERQYDNVSWPCSTNWEAGVEGKL